MTIRQATGAEFWIVVDASGRILAQGRKALCELIAAGLPIFVEQGNLFG